MGRVGTKPDDPGDITMYSQGDGSRPLGVPMVTFAKRSSKNHAAGRLRLSISAYPFISVNCNLRCPIALRKAVNGFPRK
jgi:hypothetical protein